MARIGRKQGGHVSKHPSTTKRALLRAKDYNVQGRINFQAVGGSVKPIDPKRVTSVSTKVGANKSVSTKVGAKSSKVFLSLIPQKTVKNSKN